jgi:membrane-associated phospholipid phosphatase
LGRLGLYLRLVLLLDLLFVAVYGGMNWLTSRRSDLFEIYFDWETRLPFVPGLIWIYFSIVVLFVLPLFQLDERGMRRLARRIALAIVVSGAVYLVLPARLGFERPREVPGYDPVFQTMYALDPPHNLVPSLHIAYSTLILAALCAERPARVQALGAAWLALICVSVVLVHQHHLADVAGGLAVSWLSWTVTNENGGNV